MNLRSRQFRSFSYFFPYLFFAAAVGVSLSLSSCGSITAASASRGGEESGNAAAENALEESVKEERLPAQEVSEEISIRNENFTELFYTLPKGGRPVFLAVVPRRADRKEEYEFALWEIARQAAIFTRVGVRAKFITAQTTAEFGHDEKIDIEVDNSLTERLREKVVALQHLREEKRTVLVGTVEGLSAPQYSVPRTMKGDLPEWTLSPPEIEGHLSTVGTAEKRYFLRDSVRAADKVAMANLARRRRLKVENLSDQYKSNAGAAYRELNLENTEAVLEGFYILARWYYPEENLYYSLAVCARAE
jgi:hypothetical protein